MEKVTSVLTENYILQGDEKYGCEMQKAVDAKNNLWISCGYSTEMAITDLYNRVVKYRDESYNSCCLFLDLSKAFDTVNHKLGQYGIQGKMFDLLSSYITNRKQFSKYNNIKSKVNIVVCGIPQGSTLVPLLFSIYINDRPATSYKFPC